MKLENDKLIIESRSEISLLQDMIDCYIKHEKIDENDKKGLETVNRELESLFYSW